MRVSGLVVQKHELPQMFDVCALISSLGLGSESDGRGCSCRQVHW